MSGASATAAAIAAVSHVVGRVGLRPPVGTAVAVQVFGWLSVVTVG
jgi:hypothetical protein